jgi:Immunity protein 35
MLVDLSEARSLADAYLVHLQASCPVEISFNYDLTEEYPVGFVFFYNSNRFWRTRELLESLAGNGPLLVRKRCGKVLILPSHQSVKRSIAELMLTRVIQEIDRLRSNQGGLQQYSGELGTTRFLARCKGDAANVERKAKDIMLRVDELARTQWPADTEWSTQLPAWFVNRCAKEMTQEEATRWLGWWRELSGQKQAEVELAKEWCLLDWLYWLVPENRTWYWWDSEVRSADCLIVNVEVDGWPFPWGSLSWLLRASGAIEVEPEPNYS